jgi:hypothetical protein
MKKILLTAIYIFVVIFFAHAQSVVYKDNWMRPDGPVNSIVQMGNTVYLGGEFSNVGWFQRNGASINGNTGFPERDYFINGAVNAVIQDGNGGWYIGGSFSSVNGQTRNRLARINADGSLNTWNPNSNNVITSLVRSGSTVYAGGKFTSMGGQARGYIAAIDATTGGVTPWHPIVDLFGAGVPDVSALAIAGNTIYCGGNFTTVSGVVRNRLAAIDSTTGNCTSWDPNIDMTGTGTAYIRSMTLSGTNVIIGGEFNKAGADVRNNIAAIDIASGLATSWNPNVAGPVFSMAISANIIYVGGSFTTAGGQTRNRLAAFDLTTAALATWNPNADNTVNALTVSGGLLFAGGNFTTIGGQARNRIAAININTGTPTVWNPGFNNNVITLAVSGSSIFAGGIFTFLGSQRSNLAALDATTGLLTAWNPGANNVVNALVASGNTIYAGGLFTSVNGQGRTRLAAIDGTTGVPTVWNPGANGTVNALLAAGNIIYAGGVFGTVGGQTRPKIAAIDANTGVPTLWAPILTDYVTCLTFLNGKLYIGGKFTTVDGQARGRLASFDSSTGALSSWNPVTNLTGFTVVKALGGHGNIIYVGGQFTSVNGTNRKHFAAFDANSGSLTSLNMAALQASPQINGASLVNAIALLGDDLYLGGNFTTVQNQARGYLASFNTSTGNLSSWDPNFNGEVNCVHTSGNTIYAGGTFTSANNNTYRSYFTALSDSGIFIPVTVTANNNPICSGNPVTFTAVASNAGASPTYQWRVNTTAIAGATNSSYTTSTLNSTDIIDCIVTSSNPDHYTGVSNRISVVVNNCTPVITSVTPSGALCQNGTISIDFAADAFNPFNVFTAQLSNASGSFASPVTLGTLSATNGGTITGTLSNTQPAGSGYRVRIVSSSPSTIGPDNGTNLTVAAKPTNAQIAVTASSTSICSGGSVNLTVPNSAGFSYQWLLSNAAIAGATSGSFNAASAGSYKVEVTNTAGCSRLSSVQTITSVSAPVATIAPSTSQAICSGSSVVFNANTGTGLSYQWRLNSGSIAGATASSYTASAAGNYDVIVTNSGGCKDTSDQVNVFVSCDPQITTTGTRTRCAGDTISVVYTSFGVNPGNIFTLQLSNAAGSFASPVTIGTMASTGSGTITGLIPIGTSPGTGYKLRLLSSDPPGTSNPSPLTLVIKATITDVVTLCAITVDSASGKNLLIWNKPLSSNIDSFVIYRLPGLGPIYEKIAAKGYSSFSTYLDISSDPAGRAQQYYITAKNDCGETAPSPVHRTMHLTINQGENNHTWNLIWNGYEGFPHNNYSIWRGSTPTSMTLLTTIDAHPYNLLTDYNAPTGTIYYKVSVTDGPGCSPSARTTSTSGWISSNVASNQGELDMVIYPSPSAEGAQILVQSTLADEVFRIRVMDITGRTISQKESVNGTPVSFGIDLSPGIYTVQATGASASITKKWVKQ